MGSELLQALLALAACFIPLGFAWFALTRTVRRHRHPRTHEGRDPRQPKRKDPTMR